MRDIHRVSQEECLGILSTAKILRSQPISRSSNYTLLVELGRESSAECRAVYKPGRGEAPLWDFPAHCLYKREYLAYVVSEALGWGLVPPTVVREGPYGVGSVQLFVTSKQGCNYFDLLPSRREDLLRIAVFDCLVNNADRKAGHCLMDGDKRIWAIDHGLTFHAEPKLRTVMWDLCDDPVPDDWKADIERLAHGDRRSLEEALSRDLSEREVRAFYDRIDITLKAQALPMRQSSDPLRPYPWPLI